MTIPPTNSTNCNNKPQITYFKMIFLGIFTVLPCVLCGMTQNYSAVALPQMHLDVSSEAYSWFASISGFMAIIGSIFIGIVMDVFGRRTSLLFGVIFHITGWFLIYLDRGINTSLIGRAFTGITTGSAFYPAQVYAGECLTINSSPRLRSNFSTWPLIANSVGIILTFSLSCFYDYLKLAALATILASVFFILIFVFIPESPAWLRLKGRTGDADASERKLGIFQPSPNGIPTYTAPTLVENPTTLEWSRGYLWSSVKSAYGKLKRKDVYKPMVTMTVLLILSACTGGSCLLAYMVQIMTPTYNSADRQIFYKYSVFSGILVLTARILTGVVVPLCGAKRLTIFTCIFYSVGMFLIGYTFLDDNFSASLPFLRVFAVWLATFMGNFGVATVPASIMGDIFPADAKGFASVPILFSLWSMAAAVKIHPSLTLYFQDAYVYYGYAVATLVYAIYVKIFMPEVVGKTLTQINEEFR